MVACTFRPNGHDACNRSTLCSSSSSGSATGMKKYEGLVGILKSSKHVVIPPLGSRRCDKRTLGSSLLA